MNRRWRGLLSEVTLLISLALTAVCEIFNQPLMRLFGASDQTLGMASEYFAIVAGFFPSYLLLNVLNTIIRADDSPTYAMVAMLAGAIVNIILDSLFIYVLHWGVAGAAWATGIGQVVSFVMCTVYFFKAKSFRLEKKSFLPDLQILRSHICYANFHRNHVPDSHHLPEQNDGCFLPIHRQIRPRNRHIPGARYPPLYSPCHFAARSFGTCSARQWHQRHPRYSWKKIPWKYFKLSQRITGWRKILQPDFMLKQKEITFLRIGIRLLCCQQSIFCSEQEKFLQISLKLSKTS